MQQLVATNLCELFGEESQRITAEKLGVSIATVGYWRNGRTRPTYEALILIADLYNTTIDWILGRHGAVRTREAGVETVCTETGLSEKAVKNLKRLPFKNTMSLLLENPRAFDYFEALQMLSSAIYRLDKDAEQLTQIQKSGADPIPYEIAIKEDIDQIRMQRFEASDCAAILNEAVYNGSRAVRKGKRILAELDPLQTEELSN